MSDVSVRPVQFGFWVVVLGVETRFFEAGADADREAEYARVGLAAITPRSPLSGQEGN